MATLKKMLTFELSSLPSTSGVKMGKEEDSFTRNVSEETMSHWMPTSWVERSADTGELSYVCLWSVCTRTFSNRDNFIDHLYSHLDSEEMCKCDVRGCQKVVSTIYELKRHFTMHVFQADSQLTGSQAMAEYPELKNVECCGFDPLINVYYDGEVLICQWNECGRPFTSVQELFEHVTRHVDVLTDYDKCNRISNNGEEKSMFSCLWGSCCHFFENRSTLKRHVNHHSGMKCIACPFCARFFSRKEKLVEHTLRRAEIPDELAFKCKLCQKSFGSERLLCLHMTRHISNLQCPLCGLGVGHRSDLHRHLMLKHASRSKDHVCEVCEKTFYSESELTRHSAMHAENQHKCDQCEKTFRWRKQWVKHIKSHDKDYNSTPYMCHICDQNYSASFSLSRHLMKVHKCGIPDGFSRYSYKKCSDGMMRLQTNKMFREEIENSTKIPTSKMCQK